MIYDIKTSNKSFLRMASELKKRGVKNNKFMLVLYDETLVGVDPHSNNLTQQQKAAIFRECSINKWYYMREVIRIPVDGVAGGIQYKANLGNVTLSYLRDKNKNIILLLPRQHGKTMGEVAEDSWSSLFASINANAIYVNKQFPDAKKNLKIFKDLRLALPPWLRELLSHKDDKDNEEYKLVASRNNTITAKPAANTIEQADKLGRGLTTSLLWFDEFAFLKFNDTIYTACLPAWKTAADNAKAHGTPYGIVITTTPNNLDVKEGAYCKSMMDKACRWKFDLFDFTDEELDEYIRANSLNDFVAVEYSYRDLGRDEAWLQQMTRELNGDMAKVKREILLEWPRSMDSSVFSEEQIDRIYHFVKESPVGTIMVNNIYPIDFYEEIDLEKNYIISCDVSGGLSNDNSVMLFIDPGTFKPVGLFKSAKIDTDSFRQLIHTVMTLYFRNAILIIESNSYGLNILDTFMKDPQIEPRMYKENRERVGEKTQKDGFTVRKSTKTVVYGVATTAASRKLMFDLLMTIVDEEYELIIVPDLYKDISMLEKKKNGKIEHADNAHDDVLMSYLIFRYAVFYGKCLRDRFGISPIASGANIKIKSSDGNGSSRKTDALLRTVNNDSGVMSALTSSPAFQELMFHQQKINESSAGITPDEAEKARKIARFKRICNWNE